MSINSVLYDIVSAWSKEQVDQMKSILEDNKPFGKIASGYLVSSIIYHALIRGDGLDLTFANADYGKYVDAGRLPGKFPPLDAIKDWCKVKDIPESAAFPIAKSIKENGIPYVQFLDVPFNNLEKLLNEMSEVLTKEMRVELQQVVDTEFKK
jgi:hypothetical protein